MVIIIFYHQFTITSVMVLMNRFANEIETSGGFQLQRKGVLASGQ